MIGWYTAYRELAIVLNRFHIINGYGSGLELFKRCTNDSEFIYINTRISHFKENFNIASIDPIHVFASLNESGDAESSRVARLNIFLRLLDSEIRYTEIDFTGCPAPFSLKIMAARKGEVQSEIWIVFSDIVRLGQDALNQGVFDKIKKWYGIDVPSFTMFLFWIDSENFLPIDKNTNKFLTEKGISKKRPRNYDEYKKLLPQKNSDIYRKVAIYAYNLESPIMLSEHVRVIDAFFDNRSAISEAKTIDFKLLAIKTLEETGIDFLKVLKPDNFYVFFDCYDFKDEKKIIYTKEKNFSFYNLNDFGSNYNLGINISAIVGKNGSGKSSVTELLYMAINNLTFKVLEEESELVYIPNLHLELYYHTDTIYKLSIAGEDLRVVQYSNIDNVFEPQIELDINKSVLDNFFYTIAINYSHFALNSNDIGGWIQGLFYKNDGYQAPIVINPMRRDGNIDINLENSFAKSRMLSNILEPIGDYSIENSLRQITDNGRKAEELHLLLNPKKIEYLYKTSSDEIVPFPSEEEQRNIINQVYSFFEISINNENEITNFANKYIYKKLVNISRNYKRYFGYYVDDSINASLLNEYLNKIKEDNSHITYKIRQAINFLKYDHLKFKDLNSRISVNQLSNNIQKVIESNYSSDREMKTIELIPPSFFNIDIILNDGSSFDKLSSGEKQRIHSINSLMYHLTNLDSVYEEENAEEKSIKYSYVNILFDEIELYFHPDMQRTFISYLIDYLSKFKFIYIDGLNICFVTHSPFILSDIPCENVMFLKKEDENNTESKSIQVSTLETKTKTFGANIHELLATGFFLDNGFMGEFANEKIKSAIFYLEDIIENPEPRSWKPLTGWTQESVLSFIEIIGEPLIRNSLKEMYFQAFVDNNEAALNKEIERLINKRDSKKNRDDTDFK